MPGCDLPGNQLESRPEARVDQLCGTAEPHDAHVHAAVYPPDECVLEKTGESRRDGGTLFMYYNFGRVHQTLRVTPAMEAGIANHVWSIQEIVELKKA